MLMHTPFKTRQMTVCNKAFDRQRGPYVFFPIIQLCGKWLQESGFKAGHTIDMPRAQTLRRIILPQAARVSVPPLSNTFISLVKDTSLASLILVTEMFRQAQKIAAFTSEFMLVYMEAALIYWIICLFLSSGQNVIEKRLDRYVAH